MVKVLHKDPAGGNDVLLGVVTPVGDQGTCIAKTAALAAELGQSRRSPWPRLHRRTCGPGRATTLADTQYRGACVF